MGPAHAIVDALLENDPKENAFAKLKELRQRRAELHAEQQWIGEFAMALHRAHVKEENVKSLDVRDGKCYGVWLKQGDYGAKLQRKSDAKVKQNAALDAKHDENYPFHRDNPDKGYYGRQFVPKNITPREVSAYYVPFPDPLWVPVIIRDRLMASMR